MNLTDTYYTSIRGQLTSDTVRENTNHLVFAFQLFGGPTNAFEGKTKSGAHVTRYYGKEELGRLGRGLAGRIVNVAVDLAGRHTFERRQQINREIRRGRINME